MQSKKPLDKQQMLTTGADIMTLPRIIFKDGTIETLKWVALFIMTLDHINKYFFNDKITLFFDLGRVAMPVFMFVLAYNLARPGTLESGAYVRVMKRLFISGLIAFIPTAFMKGLLCGWWPLNIMFTLLVVTATIYLIATHHPIIAQGVFFLGCAVVEFWWFAGLFGVAVWWYCRKPNWTAAILIFISWGSLWVVNQNSWAFAALPLIWLISLLPIEMPKYKYLFYAYYPLHLTIICLVVNYQKIY